MFNRQILRHVILMTALVAAFMVMGQDVAARPVWLPQFRVPFFGKSQPTQPPQPPQPAQFAWVGDTLTAKGSGKSSSQDTPKSARESARAAAYAAGYYALMKRVENLRVTGGMKLGAAMDAHTAVRYAVETWAVRNAACVYTDRLTGADSTGVASTVELNLPLAGLVEVLKKRGVTPTALPAVNPLPTAGNIA